MLNLYHLYYIIPCAVLFSVILYFLFRAEKEMMYFRFSCENVLDIDYYDYVNNYAFFNLFNDQLSNHLRGYVQDHFRSLGVGVSQLQLSAQVEYETITIACYLEAKKADHDYIQCEIVKSVNLELEARKFYAFYEKVRDPKYDHLFRLKQPNEA